MKKIMFLVFTIQTCLYSQDTATIKYFPLSSGNKWVYDRVTYFSPGPGKDVSKIDSTFVNNNHRYYLIRNTMYLSNGTVYSVTAQILRVDSLSGNIYLWSTTGECLVDSLKSKAGDTAFSCAAWGPPEWFKCQDTNTYSIFGQNPKTKNFAMLNGFEASVDRRYGKNFGIVYKHSGAVMYHTFYYLKGCIINGVLFGDTTLTGIEQISSEIPNGFSLSQNYPNPFNPVTKIKFDIPLDSRLRGNDNVTLKIYDVLGREVAVLVNEQLLPGTYDVEWDASNYTSGVYFYQLSINNEQLATKKMVLLK